jgi:non-ribosomal peptide synthase protein (TIGR01720 family)
VGQLWVHGGQVSWEQMREGEVRRREQVPGYAFERERFWIEPAQTEPNAAKVIRQPDIADWFYVPSWKQAPLGMEFNADALIENPRTWLILIDESGVGRALSEKLLAQQQRVITVRIGERFVREDETAFVLDLRQPEHYRQLFSLLQAEHQLPHKVLHLWGVEEAAPQDFEAAQSRGLYSLLYLTQALAEVGLDHDVELEVVTTGTQEVSGAEQLHPAKATVLGACKVIPQEHSRLQCRAIDVELNGGATGVSRVAEQLLAEVSERIGPRVVAYRGAHRWEQSYERVRVTEGAGRRLRHSGVYLITGGFGGVGQALAGHLAAEVGAKLVLVSRSGGEEASRMEAVQRLEALGAEVLVLRADASDEQEMRAAVAQTLERFGQLNGVIHAAGIAGGAIIEQLGPQILQTTFEAKIKGTLVLDHLLRDVDLDFLLLCSSHRSILGGLGRVDYAAANAFLDVYARAENCGRSRYVVSVNWDTWRDVGMAVDVARQHGLDPAEAIQEGVYASEGVEAFKRILNTNLPQVIVSPEDFQARVKESENLSATKMLEELEKQSASRTATEVKLHERPELSSQYVEPRNEVERTLSGIWEKILGIAPIGIQDNYLELGGDSVLSIQIVARANQAGLKLAPRHMFEHQTIEALAAVAGTTAKLKAEQGLVSGVAPLTPIQHWFFEQELADAHHYNQAVMLELRSSISSDGLRDVVGKLLLHHDALRMRFKRNGAQWQQENAKYEDEDVLQLIDVSEMPAGQQSAEIEAHAQQVQKQLDFEHGPLMRVVLYDLGAGKERRLLVVIHHLVIDAVSWGILLEDLQRGCEQFKRGDAIDFGAKTTSYREWAESLQNLARNGAVDHELSYWTAAARSDAGRMPLDAMEGSNDAGSVDVVRVSLKEEETTSLLQQVGKAYNTTVEEALLTSLREAYEQWTGQDQLLVDVEGHGREEIEDGVDVTRTVGWFTSIYPVLLENQEDANVGKRLTAVKETMRQVKRSGLGYGMLRYLGSESEKLKQLPEAEIIFLYLGQLDRVIGDEGDLGVASESAGESRSARGKRKHLLEISSAVTGGKLELSWNYSKNLHSRETIEKLAEDHVEFLRELIMHCQSPDAKGYTPSDFPDVSLTQAELDALIARLS